MVYIRPVFLFVCLMHVTFFCVYIPAFILCYPIPVPFFGTCLISQTENKRIHSHHLSIASTSLYHEQPTIPSLRGPLLWTPGYVPSGVLRASGQSCAWGSVWTQASHSPSGTGHQKALRPSFSLPRPGDCFGFSQGTKKKNCFSSTLFLRSLSFFPFPVSPPLSSWEKTGLVTGGLSVFSSPWN